MKVQVVTLRTCLVPFPVSTFPYSLGPAATDLLSVTIFLFPLRSYKWNNTLYPLLCLLVLVWYIFFHLLLFLKWVSQIQHKVRYFFLYSLRICLLVVVFFPFAYNIIIDMVEFKSTILLLFSIYPSGLYSFFFYFLINWVFLFISTIILLALLCFISGALQFTRYDFSLSESTFK